MEENDGLPGFGTAAIHKTFCGLIVTISSVALLSSCQRQKQVASAGSSRFSLEQLAAIMPADLGPDSLDVSAYPKEQRENYGLFASRCSQCHTLARPINSSLVTRNDWTRYAKRMKARLPVERVASPGGGETQLVRTTDGKVRGVIPASELTRIVDFLVYDSRARKAEEPELFQAEQAKLNQLFAEVKEEKKRLASQLASQRDQDRYTSP